MIFKAATQARTEGLAQEFSLFAKPGFTILLKGDLGSGKSTFARAFIKALAPVNSDFDVPSPSFSLIQIYTNTRLPVAHVDLYRLRDETDIDELGLDELSKTHIILIEWPNLTVERLSANQLTLEFSGQGALRNIRITASGAWGGVVKRNAEIVAFLEMQAVPSASRRYLDGDASARRYEYVTQAGRDVILMDMPQRPAGPPVKDGKPYGAIAHLAEGISAVVAINDGLLQRGLGAPEIYACDMQRGFALVENLGANIFYTMFRQGRNMQKPMQAATAVLAEIAGQKWPQQAKLQDGRIHNLPSYDIEAQLIEVGLLPSWFHRHVHKVDAPAALNESFAQVWAKVLPLTRMVQPVWVLRDFHSPNLFWLPEREGLKSVGIINTQDALLGHPAYDLAALLQDARTDIDFAFADALYAHYVKLRKAQGPFDEAQFARVYAILGVQRATKILGIFARLNRRDGKPQYLRHMPRVSRYLWRGLQHPVLAGVKAWYETHLPAALELGQI